jgi:AAHS family 4-hydroxybenzoate transporter-like MFS transporter
LLLASLAIFGLASLLSAFAGSLSTLSVLRFFTGLGIGGAFPGAATLAGDYAPRRLRATMIMATFTGAPLGGFLGGQLVALLLHQRFAWPVIFLVGGSFPLVLVLVLAAWLPESPRFLAARTDLGPRDRALLQRLDIAPSHIERQALDLPHGNPIKMLFGEGYALQTLLLWVIFFSSLLNLFLFGYWLPTVLTLIGMTPSQAVFASSLRDFGAIWAALYLGLMIDRVGPERSLAFHYAAGAVFIGLIALVAMPSAVLLAVIFFFRHDDRRQPDRGQRHLRRALPGADAHERARLGARRRPPRRDRSAGARRLPVGPPRGADPHFFERLPVRDRGGGGDRPVGIARPAR